jgi:hypothetical protein
LSIFSLMKTYHFLFILWPGLLAAQSDYFWLAIDYQNIWNTSNDVVETNHHYVIAGSSGAWASVDVPHLTLISKKDMEVSFYVPDFFESSSLVRIRPGHENKTLIVLGWYYNGPVNDLNNADIFLLELDIETLDTVRLRTFGLPGRCESPWRMILTQDGGIAITGWSFSTNPLIMQSVLLLKVDSLWNEEYLHLYSQHPQRNHFGSGLLETGDGGFIIAGARRTDASMFPGSSQYKTQAVILRVDAQGQVVFWENFLPQGQEIFLGITDIMQKENGNYLGVGSKSLITTGVAEDQLFWALEFDSQGSMLWSKTYGSFPDKAQWVAINPAGDGNYLVCGYLRKNVEYSNGAYVQPQYGVVGKLSPEGELLWHRLHMNNPVNKNYDFFWNAIETTDGGILCVGTTWSDSLTRQDIWAVKLDQWGCHEPGCEPSTATEEAPLEEEALFVYPNPFTDRLVFDLGALSPAVSYELSVFDATGRPVWRALCPGGQALDWTPDERLAPGLYYYLASLNGRVAQTGKLLRF